MRISQVASQQEGSSVYLEANEQWSLESLFYGTMLQSGNDAAVAIAMKDEQFQKIASAKQYVPKERRVVWVNKHRLVKENKAIAGKIGYTSVAGRTLLTEFAEGEKRLIVATLGDRDDWISHMHLSRHTFETTTLEQIEGTYLAAQNIMITVSRPFRYLHKKRNPSPTK